MTAVWVTIALLAVGTVVVKAIGPVTLGGRVLPPRVIGVISLLAPALLAALVVVQTFGKGSDLVIDARVVGLTAAALSLWARLPLIVVALAAAAATALTRAVA